MRPTDALRARVGRWRRQRAARHLGRHDGRLNFPADALAGAAFCGLLSVTLFGALGVVLFIATVGLLMLSRPAASGRDLLLFSPLLIFPVYACLSTLWSDAPQATLRGGLQLLFTIVAAILIARNLRPERMLLLLFLGFLIVCLLVAPGIPHSLASRQPVNPGFLGSKNQVSFAAHLLGAVGIALIIDGHQPWWARLLAIAALPLVALLTILAHSGGGTTSFLITLVVFPALVAFRMFKLPVRIAFVAVLTMMLGIMLAFVADIQNMIADYRTNVLGKDATLTGRTYLWEFAARLSAERPLLGRGYGAFWQQGNIDAEGLWRWGGIGNRSGFNFHNAFVGTQVDLGLVGVVLLISLCVGVALLACYRQIVRPSIPMAFFIGLIAVTYVRSYVEEGLLSPFGVVMVVWLATAIYALDNVDVSRVRSARSDLQRKNPRFTDLGGRGRAGRTRA